MQRSRWLTRRSAALAGAALILAACASTPPPTGPIAVARAAVAEAETAGAAERAPAHLARARAKLTQAEAALQRRQHDEAGWLAEQATVDAQLAVMAARAAAADATLGTVQRGITELQRELERSGSP